HAPMSHIPMPAHSPFFLFLLTLPPPPTPTLFPYTTLFRSVARCRAAFASSSSALRSASTKCRALKKLGSRDGESSGIDSYFLEPDRKSTRLNSSHQIISYAVFCLKKKKITKLIEHISKI